MNKEELARRIIDKTTKRIKDHAEQMNGVIVTHEQAEKEARKIAERCDRKGLVK